MDEYPLGKAKWGTPKERSDRHQTWGPSPLPWISALGPPTSNIWWWSLETCSNLFTGEPPWYWHLVTLETWRFDRQLVSILLEYLLVNSNLDLVSRWQWISTIIMIQMYLKNSIYWKLSEEAFVRYSEGLGVISMAYEDKVFSSWFSEEATPLKLLYTTIDMISSYCALRCGT